MGVAGTVESEYTANILFGLEFSVKLTAWDGCQTQATVPLIFLNTPET